MRILQLHCDFIEYEPLEKEIKEAEECERKPTRLEDVVVLFVAVEKGDNESVAKHAVEEIKSSLDNLKAGRILIYPYAHLSGELAPPAYALDVIKAMENYAKSLGIEVHRAPFGWNKRFSVRIKGHPLAEQGKVIRAKDVEELSKSLRDEEKIASKWYILTPEGGLNEIAMEGDEIRGFDFSRYPNLEKFARYEMKKSRAVDVEPPHVKLMKRLELADYEPGSDPGNLRWYPKGRLIKNLLERWVTERVIDYGAMEVETPVMYDYNHPALKDYLHRFPARQYIVESAKRKFFLRFAACFGQFLMKHDMVISYKNLPLRMYELTRYSFRLEKSGELVGLRRLRAFTMPDMHTLCKDMEQAKEEFKNQFELCMRCLKDIGFSPEDYETAIRFTEEFWEHNREFVIELVKKLGKPVLIEMWNFRYAYFDPKFEFNFVDALGKASALSTVQIDHENAKRYGITYTDSDGSKKYPYILHCSPSGAIERCIYAMLEREYMKSPERATLPLWLSPTQVRICPVSDEFLGFAEEVSEKLESRRIRVDIDDRNETIQRKVRDAEVEWIPIIVVVGKKERESGKLSVRFRRTGEIREMALEELAEFVASQTAGFPFVKLSLPKFLSKRPIFVG